LDAFFLASFYLPIIALMYLLISARTRHR
jgi:hypothetical protein